MAATMHRSGSTGGRAPLGQWLAACAAALALLGTVLFAGRAYFGAQAPELTAQALTRVQQPAQALCVEGALMSFDVQWAAACATLAEKGQSDGHAECELPPAEAGRINRLLQQAEQRCLAEAAAGARRR